jgi:hypothetical protein
VLNLYAPIEYIIYSKLVSPIFVLGIQPPKSFIRKGLTLLPFHSFNPGPVVLTESSLLGFGGLDDNPIKGLTSVLSVEQVLNAKLIGFNTSEQV